MNIVTSERGKGWLEDNPSIVEEQLALNHIESLVGAPALVTAALDHTHLLDKIPDQRSTSSCVGQAFATCLLLTAKLAGIDIPRPSAKAIYDFARAEDQPYVHLQDYGSRPLAAMKCLVDNGMVAEEQWPIIFHPEGYSNINVRPPLDVYQSALGYRVGDYYRIAKGTGAASRVRQALACGYCPVFAMPVDAAFEQMSDGSVYEGRIGPSLGGHMQCIAGCGDKYLIVVGSWGTSFGANGIVKISDEYFDSGECSDIIVPTIVPVLAVE